MTFITMLIVGLIAGALARFLVPGKDPMGLLGTLVLGLVGAFIGGSLSMLIGDGSGVGIIGSTIGAIVALLVYRAIASNRSHA